VIGWYREKGKGQGQGSCDAPRTLDGNLKYQDGKELR
jgi:hypothetical protein